jgi:hypothetical protein
MDYKLKYLKYKNNYIHLNYIIDLNNYFQNYTNKFFVKKDLLNKLLLLYNNSNNIVKLIFIDILIQNFIKFKNNINYYQLATTLFCVLYYLVPIKQLNLYINNKNILDSYIINNNLIDINWIKNDVKLNDIKYIIEFNNIKNL